MREDEVIKFVSKNNCSVYLLTLCCGDSVIAKWDNDQEHFYSYLNDEDARQERERYKREYGQFYGTGMPDSADDAAHMYIGVPKAPRRYKIIKPSQVKAISTYIR